MSTLDITHDFLEVVDNLEAVTVRPPLVENSNSELVDNGYFESSLTDWDFATNFSWEEAGIALSAGAVSSFIAQSITTVIGVEYILAFDLMMPVSGGAPGLVLKVGTLVNDSSIQSYSPTYSGRHVRTFTATDTTTWITLRSDDTTGRYGNITCRALNDTSVANALRRAISTREIVQSKGQWRQGDVRWHIYETQLTSPPAMGSVIIDGNGTEWTVLAVDRETLDSRWRCWCRNNALALVGETLVEIQKAAFTKGTNGAQVATFGEWAVDVRARVQRLDAQELVVENGRRVLIQPAEIYTLYPFQVDNRFRVVDSYGQAYKVTGFRYPDSIDQLFTITAEAHPWPLS